VYAGRVGLPVVDGSALRGLLSVDLGPDDVPSFVAAPDSYRMFLDAVVGQFDGLELADDVFVNSFLELEQKVMPLAQLLVLPTCLLFCSNEKFNQIPNWRAKSIVLY
jgi:hypothetical protein